MSEDTALPWAVWQRKAALVAAVGLLVWGIGTALWHGSGFRAYWFAWVFWSGVALGSLVLCCLQFLTRGDWSLALQRPLEAGIATLPVMALLFLPVLLDTHAVFPWTHADALQDAPHKRAYLTVPWFTVRTLVCFTLLIILAWRLRLWSSREERGLVEMDPPGHLRALGAGGLVLYGACMLVASTDWVMSLEPRWFSTMFVVIFGISQLLTALAGSVALILLLPQRAGYHALFQVKRLRDLGNLVMAFVIFWTYVSFSQFLIIWSGNLPRETSWYVHRSSPGWRAVLLVLAFFQFLVPFALLLSRTTKRRPERLAKVALLVFAMNVVNVFWMVVPSFEKPGAALPWLCIPVFVGLGGLWALIFLRAFQRRPLVPRVALPAPGKEAVHA